MAIPSDGVRVLLLTAGVVTNPSDNLTWPAYISQLPDSKDNTVGIFDTGGSNPDPRWLLDRPDVTVLIRSNDYTAGYSKAKEIKDVLVGIPAQEVQGDHWCGIIQIGDIVSTGYDIKERVTLSLTLRIWIEPAPSSNTNRLPL